MFEEKRQGNWNYTWAGILGVVVLVISVVQIFRVNAPDKQQFSDEAKIVWTEGEILNGEARIEASGYLPYPLILNRRGTLKVFFTTGKNDKRLECVVIRNEDFNMWKRAEPIQTLVSTGSVPRGTITKVLDPGNYLLILDNRNGSEEKVLSETEIKVE